MSKNYLRQKIAKVKMVLDKNSYPPTLNRKKWKKGKRGCNCYSYIFDIPVKDRLKQVWIPGVISGNYQEIYSLKTLIEYVQSDLEALGFSYRDENGILDQDEYRIAIYVLPTFHDMPIGWHFVRQDADGSWSEKVSWNGKVREIKSASKVPPDLSRFNAHLEKVLVVKKVSN